MINLKDANGNWVTLVEEDFFQAFAEGEVHLLGLSMEEIILVKRFYMSRGGCLPVTETSIDGMRDI